MRELKTYISEGFFSNVGANNIIKPVIDAIKDASINNKIDSTNKCREFANLLTPILKNVESDIKKGKLVFEYIKNDKSSVNRTVIISLKKSESNKIRWIRDDKYGKLELDANNIAFSIATDLYYEYYVAKYSPRDLNLHSIANTIKVTEFKVA